ncbi:hypothetical protein BN1318_90016 [Staphylococcus capitis]|nr:hypothetical protein BN1318_90016 [Staphylococcus capitis]
MIFLVATTSHKILLYHFKVFKVCYKIILRHKKSNLKFKQIKIVNDVIVGSGYRYE